MPRRDLIRKFVPVDAPVKELVTKFGGQPVWLEQPEWPTSLETGQQMEFICQIALDPDVFGPTQARMAYVFMTGDEPEWVDGTYEYDGGENAVILQPGDNSALRVVAKAQGPSLKQDDWRAEKFGAAREWIPELERGVDPDFVSEDLRYTLPASEREAYYKALEGHRIGGTPGFMQGDEFPSSFGWRLLLQLDSANVPFYVSFGDAGIGYAFINDEGTEGKFGWQCA